MNGVSCNRFLLATGQLDFLGIICPIDSDYVVRIPFSKYVSNRAVLGFILNLVPLFESACLRVCEVTESLSVGLSAIF